MSGRSEDGASLGFSESGQRCIYHVFYAEIKRFDGGFVTAMYPCGVQHGHTVGKFTLAGRKKTVGETIGPFHPLPQTVHRFRR